MLCAQLTRLTFTGHYTQREWPDPPPDAAECVCSPCMCKLHAVTLCCIFCTARTVLIDTCLLVSFVDPAAVDLPRSLRSLRLEGRCIDPADAAICAYGNSITVFPAVTTYI